jgi:hypothetical protein
MKLSNFYAVALLIAVFGCSFYLNGARGRGDGRGRGSEGEMKGHGRYGGKGGARGYGKGGYGRGELGRGGDRGSFTINKENLRKQIKDVWGRVDELNKFRDANRPSDRSKFKDTDFRKQFASKVYEKAQELDLTTGTFYILRLLDGLTPEELFAINMMENEIIGIQLRTQGKGQYIKPEEGEQGNI